MGRPSCTSTAIHRTSPGDSASSTPAGAKGLANPLMHFIQIPAPHDAYACTSHLFHRSLHVARLQIYAAAGVFDDEYVEPQLPSIKRRELHAVVGRQPADVDVFDAARSQVFP